MTISRSKTSTVEHKKARESSKKNSLKGLLKARTRSYIRLTCRGNEISIDTVPSNPVRGYHHNNNSSDDGGSDPKDADPDSTVRLPKLPRNHDYGYFKSQFRQTCQIELR